VPRSPGRPSRAPATATLDVTVACTPQVPLPDGTPQWTLDHFATVAGFPASTEIGVSIVISEFGDFREVVLTTDASGSGSGLDLHDPSYFNSGPLPTGVSWTATGAVRTGVDAYGNPVYGPTIATDSGTINCGGLPTSKDDCKNGGWKAYGFKNQGDCISFVATHGKKFPSGSEDSVKRAARKGVSGGRSP
jgi:hypothetical protein